MVDQFQPGETARQVAVRQNNEAALQVIRGLGVQVVPFDLPPVDIAAIDFIRWAETAAFFDEPTRSVWLLRAIHSEATVHGVIAVNIGSGSPAAIDARKNRVEDMLEDLRLEEIETAKYVVDLARRRGLWFTTSTS